VPGFTETTTIGLASPAGFFEIRRMNAQPCHNRHQQSKTTTSVGLSPVAGALRSRWLRPAREPLFPSTSEIR